MAAPAPRARRPSLAARARYRFDNALSRGPFVVIAYLALLTLLVIVAAAVVATLAGVSYGDGSDDAGFWEAVWQTMLRTVDAGTFADDGPWSVRVLSLVVTLIGIFLAGSLIGLIANAVDQRVEELRRGRGVVIESGHTLVLGWSNQVPRIIAELVVANESRRSAVVVVLAPQDKTLMEETVRAQVPDTRTTRVVCRTGDPAVPADLERACAMQARSIVVVRDEDGDAGVVTAILAIRTLDPTFARCHVVADVADLDTARTLRTVTDGRVLTVSSDVVVAEVTAQACQQSGLAAVFSDLLDFGGHEVYFAQVPELVGRTYAEARLGLDASSVVGRATADGTVQLNPPGGTVLQAEDSLVVVAEDDATIAFTGVPPASDVGPPPMPPESVGPVRALVVGWSDFGVQVLEQLDEFLMPGSSVRVHVDDALVDPQTIAGLSLRNAPLAVVPGRGLEDLRRLVEEERPDQVIVLAYRDALPAPDADARTLLTLLTLRTVFPTTSTSCVRIVAELLDQRNLAIATPVGIDDLIVSDALGSLMIAQLAERAELQAVFDDLFRPEGAVISLRPAPTLVPPSPLAFGDVVAAAGGQGLSTFGYRVGTSGEVVLNPSKSSTVTLGDGDHVLVIGPR